MRFITNDSFADTQFHLNYDFRKSSRPYAGNIHVNPVQPRGSGYVKSFAVGVSPGQIRGLLRELDCSQVFAFGSENPYAAGTNAIDISLLIDFHAVGNTR